MAAFQAAKVVVGPEGSAFSGVVFAPPGVAVIEWGYSRCDTWVTAEYYGLAAAYFQLMPRWYLDTSTVSAHTCFESTLIERIDNCPWHLAASDVQLYKALLGEVLLDGGSALRRRAAAQSMHVRTQSEAEAAVAAAEMAEMSNNASLQETAERRVAEGRAGQARLVAEVERRQRLFMRQLRRRCRHMAPTGVTACVDMGMRRSQTGKKLNLA